MINKNKAAIIIVNWNGKRFLSNCLNAVYGQSYKTFEVYFVDNGSTDGSLKFVMKNYPQTKVISLKENTGFAKGNNLGITEAFKDKEVKYIIFLNNDTIVDKNWLKELITTAEQDESIGMVSSKSLFPDGRIQTIGMSLEQNIYGDKDGGISIGFGAEGSKFKNEIDILCPTGVSALYKRSVLEDVGFFDEDFFAYAEDLDLGLRARLVGWNCIYNPKSKLVHLHSQTGEAASPFKAFYSKRNTFFVVIKNFPFIDMLLFPLRDWSWNIRHMLKKNKLESLNKLKSNIGILSLILLTIKIYFGVFINLPKMLKKRRYIQKSKKLTKKEIKDLFVRYNRDNIESNSIIPENGKYKCLFCNCVTNAMICKKHARQILDGGLDKSRLNRLYNMISEIDNFSSNIEYMRNLNINIQNYMFGNISRDSKILELGAGGGFFSERLYKNGFVNLIATDISLEAVNKIKSKGISSFQLDVGDLNLIKDKFDIIMAFELIEHLLDIDTFFKNAYQILEDNGKIIFTTPNKIITRPYYFIKGIYDHKIWHPSEQSLCSLKRMLKKNGFNMEIINNKTLTLAQKEKFKKLLSCDFLANFMFKIFSVIPNFIKPSLSVIAIKNNRFENEI